MLGSVYDIGRDGRPNHRIGVMGGLMEDERPRYRATSCGGYETGMSNRLL